MVEELLCCVDESSSMIVFLVYCNNVKHLNGLSRAWDAKEEGTASSSEG